MNTAVFMTRAAPSASGLAAAAAELAPWFHNLHLPDGTQTAPNHALGDFPAYKWRELASHIPDDLTGWTALDIGCNAGYYAIELARRGAHVTGIDRDPHFLRQAHWAVRQFGLEKRITLREAQVYDLARWSGRFDLVLFMGVFYHLRHPLLALDLVAEKTSRLLVFQTLTMPGETVAPSVWDLGFDEREKLCTPGWPAMAFIENRLAGDPTNWWAPNHAGVLAMLRSSGFEVVAQPGHEMYLCAPRTVEGDTTDIDREELLAATGRSAAR